MTGPPTGETLQAPLPAGGGAASDRPSRVLIIDDDATSRAAVRWVLSTEGYGLAEASSGQEALDRLPRFCPDVIVCDIVIPDIDGIELLRRINDQTDPPLVVLVTAFGSQDITIEALRLGAYNYLSKPVQMDELRRIVRNAAEKRRLERQNRYYYRQLEELLEQLKQSQAALVQSEKIGSMGRLVAGVSHEINTPLGVLQSSTDTIERASQKLLEWTREQDAATAGPVQALVEVLGTTAAQSRAACDRIAGIVANLRDFAQLDRADFQFAQIHEGLESAVALIGHELGDDIEIVREYGEIPPIVCSPRQLNQMFMNLLLNAAEAIRRAHHPGVVRIRTWAEDGNVKVEIADNGAGIPEGDMDKIFDPGYTTKGVKVGIGLGLPICYQIAQGHGGNIEVRSTPGEGATFTVTLPMRREGEST